MTTVSFATNESTSASLHHEEYSMLVAARGWNRWGGGFPPFQTARRFALLVHDAFTIVFLNESSRKCGRTSAVVVGRASGRAPG